MSKQNCFIGFLNWFKCDQKSLIEELEEPGGQRQITLNEPIADTLQNYANPNFVVLKKHSRGSNRNDITFEAYTNDSKNTTLNIQHIEDTTTSKYTTKVPLKINTYKQKKINLIKNSDIINDKLFILTSSNDNVMLAKKTERTFYQHQHSLMQSIIYNNNNPNEKPIVRKKVDVSYDFSDDVQYTPNFKNPDNDSKVKNSYLYEENNLSNDSLSDNDEFNDLLQASKVKSFLNNYNKFNGENYNKMGKQLSETQQREDVIEEKDESECTSTLCKNTDHNLNMIPDIITQHLSKRLQNHILLETHCGEGYYTVQFAKSSNLVLAIDQDINLLQTNKENCQMYRIKQKVEHINARFEKLPKLKADVIFINSPLAVSSSNNFFAQYSENIQIQILKAFEITNNVVINIPTNIDYFNIPDIIHTCVGNKQWKLKKFSVEIEEIYINEILNYVFLHFGESAKITKKEEYQVLFNKISKKSNRPINQLKMDFDALQKFGIRKSLNIYQKACQTYQMYTDKIHNPDVFYKRFKELLQSLLTAKNSRTMNTSQQMFSNNFQEIQLFENAESNRRQTAIVSSNPKQPWTQLVLQNSQFAMNKQNLKQKQIRKDEEQKSQQSFQVLPKNQRKFSKETDESGSNLNKAFQTHNFDNDFNMQPKTYDSEQEMFIQTNEFMPFGNLNSENDFIMRQFKDINEKESFQYSDSYRKNSLNMKLLSNPNEQVQENSHKSMNTRLNLQKSQPNIHKNNKTLEEEYKLNHQNQKQKQKQKNSKSTFQKRNSTQGITSRKNQMQNLKIQKTYSIQNLQSYGNSKIKKTFSTQNLQNHAFQQFNQINEEDYYDF